MYTGLKHMHSHYNPGGFPRICAASAFPPSPKRGTELGSGYSGEQSIHATTGPVAGKNESLDHEPCVCGLESTRGTGKSARAQAIGTGTGCNGAVSGKTIFWHGVFRDASQTSPQIKVIIDFVENVRWQTSY